MHFLICVQYIYTLCTYNMYNEKEYCTYNLMLQVYICIFLGTLFSVVLLIRFAHICSSKRSKNKYINPETCYKSSFP